MYKIIDSNIRRDFIDIELGNGVLELPPRICNVYFGLINQLAAEARLPLEKIEAAAGILNSPEISDIAKEFWRHFPQHYLRNYRMLLDQEIGISNKDQTLVIDNPIVRIVDVGSGAGACTLAHLELLAKYQEYRLTCQLPIFPVTVHVLGLDIRNFIADFFTYSIQSMSDQLAPLKVYVRQEFLVQPFVVAPILGWLEQIGGNSHMLVLGLSNVIKPFHDEHEESLIKKGGWIFSTTAIHVPESWSEKFSLHAQVIHEIFQSGFVDQICIQAIASGTNRGKTSWEQPLRDFAGKVVSSLGVSSSYLHNRVYRLTFDAELPENSWWHNEYKSTTAKDLTAWCASIIAQTEHYSLDSFWLEVVNYDNLMLAWSRARNEMLAAQWDDGLELKLFEANIEDRIRKLQLDIAHYMWEELMVENTLNYPAPKGPGIKPRPMSLGRIQDQILAVAFLQRLIRGRNLLARYVEHENSYAYRMNKGPIEILYESWWDAYVKYINNARNAARNLPNAHVLRTDLSSYFTNINQDTLVEMLRQFADITDSRSLALVDFLVRRDCGLETGGLGLPQGHSWSGVLANIYLHPVDKCFEGGLGQRCKYFRYVDDIIIVFEDKEQKDLILHTLDTELRVLGLERSEQKTRLYSEHTKFLMETEIDNSLDALGKNHRNLMARLYKLNRKARNGFVDSPHQFSKLYSIALANNQVFLAPDRLLRKIRQYLSYLRNFVRGTWFDALRLPDIALFKSDSLAVWSNHHQILNQKWYVEVDRHRQELINLLIQSIEDYRTHGEFLQDYLRRIRFAVYRLSQLGYYQALPYIIEFIKEHPELLNLRIVLTAIGRQSQEGALVDLMGHFSKLSEPEFAYVRAQILRGFRFLPAQSEVATNAQLDLIDREYLSTLELTTLSENLVLSAAKTISAEQLLVLTQKSTDPYVQKNLVFLNTAIGSPIPLKFDKFHPVVNEAFEYSRINPDLDHLFNLEPQILYDKFYGYDYPDDFDEFPDHPSAFE